VTESHQQKYAGAIEAAELAQLAREPAQNAHLSKARTQTLELFGRRIAQELQGNVPGLRCGPAQTAAWLAFERAAGTLTAASSRTTVSANGIPTNRRIQSLV
jgi:hypothetical protein